MPLELDGVGAAMVLDGLIVSRMTIADDLQAATGRTKGKQSVEYSAGRTDVATSLPTSSSLFSSSFLPWRSAPRTGVRCGIDPVDEPRPRSDRRSDTEGQILGELEGLEVIEHDGLAHSALECGQGAPEQQQGVSTEKGADPSDGGRSAAECAGQLAMGGAGLKSCGYGSQQLGAFAVVDEGEGTAGEGASAAAAAEAGNFDAASGAVGAVLPEAKAIGLGMVTAVLSGAETRTKILQSIDGCARPVHAVWGGKPRAR
jgi:hypothetical protein